jgi:hypothetical protein
MSLINQNQVTIKDRIMRENTLCLAQMKRSAMFVFNMLWKNPQHTPQEVCNMFGTDAVKAFEAHGKLQELIYLLDSSWVPLVPLKEYTKNEDGTVTINYPAPIEEQSEDDGN